MGSRAVGKLVRSMDEINRIMSLIPEGRRYRWCDRISKKEWELWVKENPREQR